jgi:hypothetical protein
MMHTRAQRVALAVAVAVIGLTAAPSKAQPGGAGQPAAPGPPASSPAPPSGPSAAPSTTAPELSDTLTGLAKTEYDLGTILFRDDDFAGAIVKFKHAHELSGQVRLLWNIGVCEKSLRHYAKAIKMMERYQKDGGTALTEQHRRDAEDLLSALRPFVASLNLTVSVPDAVVSVDDEIIGTTPLPAGILIDIGLRKIRVHKQGFLDFVVTPDVVGATTVELTATLKEEVHAGRLVLVAGVNDAIAVDGTVIATGRFDGSLPSGGHNLRVSAPSMRAYQSDIIIEDDKTRTLSVTLEANPRSTVPWLVGGGVALLLAGGVVGGYFLFKPGTAPAVPGTVSPGSIQLAYRTGGRR